LGTLVPLLVSVMNHDATSALMEPFEIALLSPLLTEPKILGKLSACSSEIKQLVNSVEQRVWQQACALSPQSAFAPHCVLERVSSWREFLRERTPGVVHTRARVLNEDDLQVNEQLDWAVVIAVIGPCRSGKSAIVERLVRQEAPTQRRGRHLPPVGTGVRACVVEAFGLRGRLRLLEIDSRHQRVTFERQLRTADGIFVVCDQSEGPNAEVSHLLSLVNAATSASHPFVRPCFLILSKNDVVGARRNLVSAAREFSSESGELMANFEIVSTSAIDGSGTDSLLHLLMWRLLASGTQSREHLLGRDYIGGCRLLHRTAGAMNSQEVLGAILSRDMVGAR